MVFTWRSCDLLLSYVIIPKLLLFYPFLKSNMCKKLYLCIQPDFIKRKPLRNGLRTTGSRRGGNNSASQASQAGRRIGGYFPHQADLAYLALKPKREPFRKLTEPISKQFNHFGSLLKHKSILLNSLAACTTELKVKSNSQNEFSDWKRIRLTRRVT